MIPGDVRLAVARALCQPWGREVIWPKYDRDEPQIDGSPQPSEHVARHLRKAELVVEELASMGFVIIRVGRP